MSRIFRLKEKGQSLVELAAVLVLLLIIVGGIVDVGSMFFNYIALQDTAQEGAIYAAYNPVDTAGIATRILKSASYPIDASQISDIQVSCGGSPCLTTSTNSCQGQKITVHIAFTYKVIMPYISVLIGRSYVVLTANQTSTILQSTATITQLGSNACVLP